MRQEYSGVAILQIRKLRLGAGTKRTTRDTVLFYEEAPLNNMGLNCAGLFSPIQRARKTVWLLRTLWERRGDV